MPRVCVAVNDTPTLPSNGKFIDVAKDIAVFEE
jgi:hypothetical protein